MLNLEASDDSISFSFCANVPDRISRRRVSAIWSARGGLLFIVCMLTVYARLAGRIQVWGRVATQLCKREPLTNHAEEDHRALHRLCDGPAEHELAPFGCFPSRLEVCFPILTAPSYVFACDLVNEQVVLLSFGCGGWWYGGSCYRLWRKRIIPPLDESDHGILQRGDASHV